MSRHREHFSRLVRSRTQPFHVWSRAPRPAPDSSFPFTAAGFARCAASVSLVVSSGVTSRRCFGRVAACECQHDARWVGFDRPPSVCCRQTRVRFIDVGALPAAKVVTPRGLPAKKRRKTNHRRRFLQHAVALRAGPSRAAARTSRVILLKHSYDCALGARILTTIGSWPPSLPVSTVSIGFQFPQNVLQEAAVAARVSLPFTRAARAPRLGQRAPRALFL